MAAAKATTFQGCKLSAASVEFLAFACLLMLGVYSQAPDSYPASFYHVNWDERLASPDNVTDYVNDAGKFLIELGGDGPGGNPAAFMETIFVEFQPCATGHPHMHTSPASHELVFVLSGSFDVGFMRNNYSAVEFKNLQPNEQVMFPGGFVHWLSNPTCETARLIQVYSDPVTNIIYPYRTIVNTPPNIFAVETGVNRSADPSQALADARARHPGIDRIMFGTTECYKRCGLPVPESYATVPEWYTTVAG